MTALEYSDEVSMIMLLKSIGWILVFIIGGSMIYSTVFTISRFSHMFREPNDANEAWIRRRRSAWLKGMITLQLIKLVIVLSLLWLLL